MAAKPESALRTSREAAVPSAPAAPALSQDRSLPPTQRGRRSPAGREPFWACGMGARPGGDSQYPERSWVSVRRVRVRVSRL